ncbi:MAG TPA: DUF1724 domain-containing protein [Thermoplasmatales archaeon]|nr:DUF1724 domain-containing protein [Thermoplasmatales archaeon]
MKHIYSIYEGIDERLKFITTSGVRIKMMLSLLERPKNSTELKDEVGVVASTVIHAARDLEKENLLEERPDGYHLTNTGKIVALKLMDIIKLFHVIKTTEDFWLSHDMEGIPPQFMERLGELQELKVVKSSPTNLLQVLSLYMKLVSKAKELRGISPVFVLEFSKLVKKLLKKGATVHLIISEEIVKPVVESYQKDIEPDIKKKVEEGHLRIWVMEGVKIAMSVTDSFISIGMFNRDGTYDFSHDMVSYNKEAINWGRELFEYYKSRAREISLI